MKLYGYAIIANKETDLAIHFHWAPGMCLAEDRQAAEKIAKETALDRFPISDGYFQHGYDLLEAPAHFMASLFAQIKPPVVRRADEDELNWPEDLG